MQNQNKNFSIKNNEIEAKLKLKLDKDINKLLAASEKTGVPLTFRGDRIVDFKINNSEGWVDVKPDQIEIGPPAILFDLTIGDNDYTEIPFNRLNISDNIIIFNTAFYSTLEIKIKFKIKFDEKNNKTTLNISISPKSNKIRDILNYELKKRDFSNNKFIIKLSGYDKVVFEGCLPDEKEDNLVVEFFKKVDYINEKMRLDLTIDEDYIIKQDDFDCVDSICKYLKNKKIPIKNISVGMEVSFDTLSKILFNNERKIILEQTMYIVKLLGNEINLGSCKVEIKDYIILNEDELIYIFESQDNNETTYINVVLKENNSDELYLDFTN